MIACKVTELRPFLLITSFNNHINNDFEIDLVLNSTTKEKFANLYAKLSCKKILRLINHLK